MGFFGARKLLVKITLRAHFKYFSHFLKLPDVGLEQKNLSLEDFLDFRKV